MSDSSRSLQLERPLVFLDIQTTGLEPRSARIVELSTLKIQLDGSEEFKHQLFNPGTAISPGASEYHGITDDDVADAQAFATYARGIAGYLGGCDLAGFGIRRFGLKVLINEFNIAGTPFDTSTCAVLDAMQVYHRLEPRDFAAAYRRYVGGGNPVTESNRGESRLHAIKEIVNGQVASADDVPTTPAAISSWAAAENRLAPIDKGGKFVWAHSGEPLINFGKYRGQRLVDVHRTDSGYLRWIAGNESFTDQQRDLAGRASEGIMPQLQR